MPHRQVYLSEGCDKCGEPHAVLIIPPSEAAILGRAIEHLAETQGAYVTDSNSTLDRMSEIMAVIHLAEFAGWLNAQAEDILDWIDSEEERGQQS